MMTSLLAMTLLGRGCSLERMLGIMVAAPSIFGSFLVLWVGYFFTLDAITPPSQRISTPVR
jgi:hypothetical protein